MKLFKSKALATVTAGLLGLSMSVNTQADVLASSLMSLDNVLFTNATTGAILDFNTDFSLLTFTTTADANASLTGFAPISTSGGNPPTSPLNLAQQCLGACPVAADDFTTLLSGPPGGTYAGADQNESGAPVANVPDVVNGGVFATPATIDNSAFVGIVDATSSATASGASNNNINSSFIFSVANPISIEVSFDALAFLEAYVDGTEQFPGFATAAYGQEFTLFDLTNGVALIDWSPDGAGTCLGAGCGAVVDPFSLNTTLSLNAPLPGTIALNAGGSGFFSLTTIALTPGVLYQFSARTTTEADAARLTAVPEPSVLALMGVGLLGMGAARRRRKTTA